MLIIIKKIFSIFFEDLQWILLALAAATVIWFIGMNLSDPYQTQSVVSRLRLDNFQIMSRENIIVLNEEELREIDVAVLVRARRSDMERLRSATADTGIVEISIDFRAVDSDAIDEEISIQELKISPNLQAGFEHVSITPSFVPVHLDRFEQQTYFVQAVQQGEIQSGFELQHIRLRNERVTISGSRTALRNVSLVEAEVNIAGVFDDVELPVELTVLDKEGNAITEYVNLSVTETTANVRVWQIRKVYVTVRGTGEVADDFAWAGYSHDNDGIEIVGPEEILDTIDNIIVEIDVTDESETKEHQILLNEWLPEGVSLSQNESNEFYVTAHIEPIEMRTFTVPRGNVRSRGAVGLYQLVDNNPTIRITISGPRSVLDALDGNQIAPEFDLRERGIGIHTVPLVIELPPGLSIVGQPPALQVQIHEPAATETNGGGEVAPAPEYYNGGEGTSEIAPYGGGEVAPEPEEDTEEEIEGESNNGYGEDWAGWGN